MIICHLPLGPTAYFGLQNVVLRHDVDDRLDSVSEAYPHLIFNNFTTKLGERVSNILKHLFPVPKVDSKRVITFSNKEDMVSFRHHTFEKESHKEVGLTEIGPRFEMKLYQIMLGLINQKEATKEWVLRPYMNTAAKRKAL
jgi:U3 small nucleolar ribonucleoprotein protein IMP4